jgi:protein-L-isoaspartate O-methyltransferase
MKEEHFATLRRHMVEVILIYVDLAGDELGKSVLDERVLAAMGRVPRHAFARRRSRCKLTRASRYRSASARRCRNLSSSPS